MFNKEPTYKEIEEWYDSFILELDSDSIEIIDYLIQLSKEQCNTKNLKKYIKKLEKEKAKYINKYNELVSYDDRRIENHSESIYQSVMGGIKKTFKEIIDQFRPSNFKKERLDYIGQGLGVILFGLIPIFIINSILFIFVTSMVPIYWVFVIYGIVAVVILIHSFFCEI